MTVTKEGGTRTVGGVTFTLRGGVLHTEDGWRVTQTDPNSWLLSGPLPFFCVSSLTTAARYIAKARALGAWHDAEDTAKGCA